MAALQGVLSPFDALRAVEVGVDGIIVSNHGGRQLDFAPATLDCVANIKRAIGDSIPILMDGGVRRGTDILKVCDLSCSERVEESHGHCLHVSWCAHAGLQVV